MYSISYSRRILIKLELSRLFFENLSNVKFHLDAPYSLRTDGQA